MKLFKRVLWPDTHCPFHDRKAVEIAIEIAREERPDELVLLGDFEDCYSVSRFTQDPDKAFTLLEDELEEGKALRARMERELRPSKVVYIEGNHENRIEKYVRGYAPRLASALNPKDVLGVPRHWVWVPWGQRNFYRCGKLLATHGTLATKHAAAAMLDKYGCSVVFGHTHKIQRFQKRNANGQLLEAFNVGWLGDKHRAMEYIENVADASQGFAIQYCKPNGDFFVKIVEIENHSAVHNGKLFK